MGVTQGLHHDGQSAPLGVARRGSDALRDKTLGICEYVSGCGFKSSAIIRETKRVTTLIFAMQLR